MNKNCVKIAFANQKGGTGKTTSNLSIAACLAELGYKCCLFDLDPQGNSTTGIGLDKNDFIDKPSMYDVLIKDIPLKDALYKTQHENIDIVPSAENLADAETDLTSKTSRENLLMLAIEDAKIEEEYDFFLFDCPPSLGNLLINGLVATEKIIVPVNTGENSIEGLGRLMNKITLLKKLRLNRNLELFGVLLTKANESAKTILPEVKSDLSNLFGDMFFSTYIHHCTDFEKAEKNHEPLPIFKKKSRGTEEYNEVTNEILRRCGLI